MKPKKNVCKAVPFSKFDLYKLWIMHLIHWLCCPLKVMRRRTINDVLDSKTKKTFAPILVVITVRTLSVLLSIPFCQYEVSHYLKLLRFASKDLKSIYLLENQSLFCLKPSNAVAITWFVGESQKTSSSVSGFFEVYYIVVVYYNLPLVRMSCVKKGLL